MVPAPHRPDARFPAAPRLFPIVGDGMEPRLRSGDFLMVAAVDCYQYETVYLLDFGDGEAPYFAQRRAGRQLHVRPPNPIYAGSLIAQDEFDQAVTAMSVAEVRVTDRNFAASGTAP